jgi:polyisoprenoid-binding protein YceI
MVTVLSIWLAWAVLLGPAPARAEEMRLVLDPQRTEISFELDATLHSVHGEAELSEGEIRFDSDGGPAEGRLVVSAPSAGTGNDRRDRDMHQKVLESERFPEIEFRPSEVRGEVALAGSSRVEIVGTFSIHGSDHPVAVEADVAITGETLEATLTFEIPYVAWGMQDPSKLLLKVGKKVQVTVHAVGTLTPS